MDDLTPSDYRLLRALRKLFPRHKALVIRKWLRSKTRMERYAMINSKRVREVLND